MIATRGLKSAAELSAARPHGERLKYMGGCRCMLCRAANSRYETDRVKARREGDWNGLVSADPVREHLAELSSVGVGRRAVCAAADVSDTVLQDIIAGRKLKVRMRTAVKVMSITAEACSDGAHISAAVAWAQIRELRREGFTKREIAHRLGYKDAIQFRPDRMTAKNVAKVDRFYRQIMAGGEGA